MRRAGAWFGSDARNDAYDAMRRAKKLAEFEWDAFDYHPARTR